MLSFKSQWSALNKVEHQKLVSKKFSDLVISQAQIKSQYELAFELCQKDIESIENKLLVSIGHDFHEQNEQRFLRGGNYPDIDESIARIATETKNDAQLLLGMTVVTTVPSFLINPFVVAAADVAVNLVTEKALSVSIRKLISIEIDQISEKSLSQFREELTIHTRLRNDQIRRILGGQI
ncbi:MAG: hypothetical protein CO175_02105 [Verrucomicrobia bacterium CG_4_9_14_3_um_filter_43_20]|nr:MAG: hypothetical protein CO175_02105 [Verrucomicrobia bacterium CG_4_9_14_3_um_filter_43_20]